MLPALDGPWLLVAALLLLAGALWREARPARGELWAMAALTAAAVAARLWFGVWGPLHVNGQGPLWIHGALAADALASYGPGYHEAFGWLARRATWPDRAIFAANALLSGLSPALLYAVARLVGVARGGGLAAAVALAADAVSIDTAASELYVVPLLALLLAVQLGLALFARAAARGDRAGGLLAVSAACLFAAAAARTQAVGYLPLALAPLVVLCGARPAAWRARLACAAQPAAAIGVVVGLSSGRVVVAALSHAPVSPGGTLALLLGQGVAVWAGALLVALWAARRWAVPPWVPAIGAASLLAMWVVESAFQRHPYQELFYARLCLPGVLLGAAALLPRRLQGGAWASAVGLLVAGGLQMPAWPYLGVRTTEQSEHAFLREVLAELPPGCTIAAVGRAGKRVWAIPAYLNQRGVAEELAAGASLGEVSARSACLVYVRSSLCSSAEGRAACDAVERDVPLARVASRVFAAAPSDLDLPYDVPQVEVSVFRGGGAGDAAAVPGPAAVRDGAPITAAFAEALYARLAPLREADGCRIVRFDTSRFRIDIGVQAPSGAVTALQVAATRERAAQARGVGEWMVAAPPEFGRHCGATLGAIEAALLATAPPPAPSALGAEVAHLRFTDVAILVSFALLVLGTAAVLRREWRARRPAPLAVGLLAAVWAAGLALRLLLSPRTFLHEYYHIAETISGHLTGSIVPAYGHTGPVLFRAVAALLGRAADIEVIFLTNAVLASLAIPAVALLDLALLRSWPRALCAAVLLAVLPLHLRFSAAEDLFVTALSFALWAAALFALSLRTHRALDVFCAALALSLAMQTRPELLFFPAVLVALAVLAVPGGWRWLFAWPTLAALALLAGLLAPRLLELHGVLTSAPSPAAALPSLSHVLATLVLLDPRVTPPLYWLLLLGGLAWGAWRTPGLVAWVAAVFFGYVLFSMSLFDNPPYRLRAQLLPTAFTVLAAAGIASAWLALFAHRPRLGRLLGGLALLALAALLVASGRGFVTELRDQQREWAFLRRSVPQLPERGTLLAAVQVGGRNLDAFPDILLQQAQKRYALVDVRQAADGEVAWPEPSGELLWYQGMFCYFAFDEDPPPEPMTAACRAVHERYVAEPLIVEDLDVPGYSLLRYAAPPYRIGFFRLTPRG
ncbi:MAG: hypothetical protein SF182_06995 [Deltaproteobacteria bacterium]|nr:hypothetical protein [Deltaproteobacteria bacterium]